MFYYFPGNYTWSSALSLALMCGGQLGEMDRWLHPLRDGEATAEQWAAAWTGMARQQEDLAARDLAAGWLPSAGERLLRASLYHVSGERQIPPGPAKSESYNAAIQAFARAVELCPLPLERVEILSPDGPLPAYLIKTPSQDPTPVVMFFGGFDVTKEILYMIVRDTFARRGITCIVADTPGTGEPLRLRGVPSRPDYEVPAGAIVDFIETRPDLDADRVGIVGISLGGYYASRAAAFEPRLKCCVAWGAILDWGKTWEKRWATRSKTVSVPWFQLPWVMGTSTMEEGLERAKQWTLVDVLPGIKQPFLMLHGENDRQIPVEDARRAFELLGSRDKTLHVFSEQEGGAEHCQTDEPDAARQLIADWSASKLRAAVPSRTRA